MSLGIQCLCVDAANPQVLAGWWQTVLGWRRTHDTEDEVWLEPPAGSKEDRVAPDLVFLKVPEPKASKNRLHIDLRPDDQGAEVNRLQTLGAHSVDVGQREDASQVVLADPEGNEFCILRAYTPDELAAITSVEGR